MTDLAACSSHSPAASHLMGSLPCPRRGFTLIELLAVIIILAMVSALTLTSLSGSGERAAIMHGAHLWHQFDQQARLTARSVAPGHDEVALVLASDQNGAKNWLQIVTRVGDGSDNRILRSVELTAGFAAELTRRASTDDRSEPATGIPFDARGCSDDYAFEFSARSGRVFRWAVSGQTGAIHRETADAH